MEPHRVYQIQEVAELTGLAPARLRAWERRYAAVRPRRHPNGYRAYDAEQVALLRALARRVAGGERIGELVGRSRAELLAPDPIDGSPLDALLAAVRTLDRERLEGLVADQLARRGLSGFARDIVLPMATAVGDLWALGEIPIAAEHLASEVVVQTLKSGLRGANGAGPVVVAACLPGERHEWGVLATFALVQEHGWRVEYLGPDLPVAEAVEAAWRLTPAAVALSASDAALVDAHLPELAAASRRLPPGAVAVIGGAGATARRRAVERAGWHVGAAAFGPVGDA